jgi:hypothetical protein
MAMLINDSGVRCQVYAQTMASWLPSRCESRLRAEAAIMRALADEIGDRASADSPTRNSRNDSPSRWL